MCLTQREARKSSNIDRVTYIIRDLDVFDSAKDKSCGRIAMTPEPFLRTDAEATLRGHSVVQEGFQSSSKMLESETRISVRANAQESTHREITESTYHPGVPGKPGQSRGFGFHTRHTLALRSRCVIA